MSRLILTILFLLNCVLLFIFLLIDVFPWYGIIIHSISICVVIAITVGRHTITTVFKQHTRDLLICTILFCFAVLLYSYQIDIITPGIQGDEITIAKISSEILHTAAYSPFATINYGHPTPLLYLTGFIIEVFGKTLLSIRLTSIVFGALSVVAFYLLLKCFFNRTVSVTTTTMMMFCYPLIVVSRLAYEITPSLFFQIVTAIFLYLLWKTNHVRWYLALGISLGAGLYTYVGFRTFAVIVFVIACFILWKKFKQKENVFYKFILFLTTCFIVTMPLLSYSITHTADVVSRASALSPFNKAMPPSEVFREIQGNIFRLTSLFIFDGSNNYYPNGDPNLKQNPSQTTMFDAITFFLFINGICFLLVKNKKILLVLIMLSLSPLINDVFSLEQIPEAHYYGLGHPNTLRIAGIIPIVFFIVAYGLQQLKTYLAQLGMKRSIYTTCLIAISSLVIFYNYSLYYYQDISSGNYYNYIYNHTKTLKLVKKINNSSVKEIYISPITLDDTRLTFFTHSSASFVAFTPQTAAEFITKATSDRLVIFDPDQNGELAKDILLQLQAHPELLSNVELMTRPDHSIEFIIAGK